MVDNAMGYGIFKQMSKQCVQEEKRNVNEEWLQGKPRLAAIFAMQDLQPLNKITNARESVRGGKEETAKQFAESAVG